MEKKEKKSEEKNKVNVKSTLFIGEFLISDDTIYPRKVNSSFLYQNGTDHQKTE